MPMNSIPGTTILTTGIITLGIVQTTGVLRSIHGIRLTMGRTMIHGEVLGQILTISLDGLVPSAIIGATHGITDGVWALDMEILTTIHTTLIAHTAWATGLDSHAGTRITEDTVTLPRSLLSRMEHVTVQCTESVLPAAAK